MSPGRYPKKVEVPGWGEVDEYECSSCGEHFYLGRVETSPGFGPVDADRLTQVIIGNPPRCADCRAPECLGDGACTNPMCAKHGLPASEPQDPW
jgi:hypothetical protein